MTDKQRPAPLRPAPTISVPDLPSDSGSWFGSRTQILEKDARFVRAHADFLDARASQANSLFDLTAARMRLFRLMAELAALPETCRRQEEHKLRMLALRNEAEATEAAIILAEARGRLSQVMGGVKPAAAPTANDALTIDDVESILAQFPEIEGDSIGKISMLLRALMREKSA